MKVLCIRNKANNVNYTYGVTIGKYYDTINDSDDVNYYILVDDTGEYYNSIDGYNVALPKYLFITESQIRDDKLNELGL